MPVRSSRVKRSRSELFSGARGVGDDEGSAVRRRDHPLRLEHAESLADRGAADAETLRQLALGRQHVARPQPAAADLREQLLGDLLVHLPALERLVAA